MSQHPFTARLIHFGIKLAGVLLIMFFVIQLAPGGPVDQYFFDLWERSVMGAGAKGPIR